MGEGALLTEKGKLEAAIINKSPLKEMGSSNHSGFLLAELCQSLVGRPVARQGEIFFPAGDGKLGWLPARDTRYVSSCWDVERVNNMSDLCGRAPPSGLLTTIFSEILLIFSE